ncbi:MAG TPA: S41 family peptidase [Polyangiales bacterium]|nr:S41 family peptidase [Polyangiales bacterium]
MQAVVLLSAMALRSGVHAQTCATEAVTADARDAMIDEALRVLEEGYVIAQTADRMARAVRLRRCFGRYDSVTDPVELATLLTRDLRSVSHDKHLSIRYSARPLPAMDGAPPPPPMEPAPPPVEPVSLDQARAFGFVRTEILPGNIGYVDIRAFDGRPAVAQAAATVMSFLASSDAVIFDLRQNGGGAGSAVDLLISYLFGTEPVHLNDFYDRAGNLVQATWTLPVVEGTRLEQQAVYVLTSDRTFSGAEAFAYTLQHLERATVVGETTGGGAHTVEPRRLDEHFLITLPTGRPVNAVTKTNWERVGVEPDVAVPAYDALVEAHALALSGLGRMVAPDQLGLPGGERWLRAKQPAAPPTAAASFRGDFETGKLDAWTSVGFGSGDWFVYTDGKVPPDPRQSDPNVPFDVPAPPQGSFAAVSDADRPGVLILYQDITLDRAYKLSASVFYDSAGALASPNVLDLTEEPNQQYRIDVIEPDAAIETLASADVLASLFRTTACDPTRLQPTAASVDLSPWQGRTVRLRLTVVDNAGPLRAGIDDIRLEAF